MSNTIDRMMKAISPKKKSPTKPVVIIAPPQMMSPTKDEGKATEETDICHNEIPVEHDLVDYTNSKRKAIILDQAKIDEAMGLMKSMDGLPDLGSLRLSELASGAKKAEVQLDCSNRDCPLSLLASHLRGLGLFANRDIPAGQLIFREAPLMACSDHILEKAVTYMALTPHNKAQFMSLQRACRCSAVGQAVAGCQAPPLLHIWATNRFDMPGEINDKRFEDAGMGLSAVYILASRINHDCDPNVQYGFTPMGEIRVWASKNIGKGEEIFRSYLRSSGPENMPTRAQRWEKLGFQCACSQCVTFPHLPVKTVEEIVGHKYYHDVRRALGKNPAAAKCPLINIVSKDEKARIEQGEEWAAGVQEDLTRRFEEFKLGSAFYMVAEMKPPKIVVTAMLVDLQEREFGAWQGEHLKKIIESGPNLPKDILVKYLEALPKCLTKKDCKDVKALFMNALQEIADDIATYKPPKKGNEIDKPKVVEDLKDILGIKFAYGSDLIASDEEEIHSNNERCDHPACLEHVEDKVGNGMI